MIIVQQYHEGSLDMIVPNNILQKCLTLYKLHKENPVHEAMVKFKG